MAEKKKIILACSVCLANNYVTNRSAADKQKRLKLMKYCPRCKRMTLHKATK